MAREKIKATILLLAVFAIVGGISWALVNGQQVPAQEDNGTNDQSPQTMPKLTLFEDIRDAAMDFIKTNHTDAAQFINNLAWIGGKIETNLLGGEKYVYQSQGWKVTITFPVIPNPVYSINAEYSARSEPGSIGIPYHVTWEGTWQNGVVAETNYVFAQ